MESKGDTGLIDFADPHLLANYPGLAQAEIVDLEIDTKSCLFVPAGWWFQVKGSGKVISQLYDVGSIWVDMVLEGLAK